MIIIWFKSNQIRVPKLNIKNIIYEVINYLFIIITLIVFIDTSVT